MWGRIWALLLRYLYLYRRSLARAGEIAFWPVMDLLVWGFVTRYLSQLDLPEPVLFLLGGLILWEVFYRSQQGITLSVTEEIWVKNLINLFVAPVRTFEIALATCLLGVIKGLLTALLLGALAWVLWSFDLLTVGAALVPFVVSLLLFGWAAGMCTAALILRFGQAAEAFVWGVPFLIQPVSAVFYPMDVLPGWLQVVSRLLPTTYIFEGMRHALRSGALRGEHLAAALAMNVVYLGLGAAVLAWTLRVVKDKGYLGRLGLE